MAPKSTIIITGANGSLGSQTALELCRRQPGRYHLELTARNTSDASTLDTTAQLNQLSPAPSFTWSTLELTSLRKVRDFATDIKARIASGAIPAPSQGGGVLNSAAVFSYDVGGAAGTTRDGFDVNYGVNVLAPVLLVWELVDVLGGALVLNMASVSHNKGAVDWFHPTGAANSAAATGVVVGVKGDGIEVGSRRLGVAEAFRRYGSSKLLLTMIGYALQRRSDAKSNSNIQIVALDPGAMSGPSHMVAGGHWLFKILKAVFTLFGPLLRVVEKSAINPPVVPARIAAALFARAEETSLAGKYFILDDELSSSVPSLDIVVQDRVLRRAMEELNLDTDL